MQDHAVTDARSTDLLRSVLGVVAENLSLDEAARQLLELAVAATGAAGGRVLLFVEPRLSIHTGAKWNVGDDHIAQVLGDLLPGMPPEPVAFGRSNRRSLSAYIAPVADDRIVGGLILLFRGAVPDSVGDVMADCAGGLRACVSRARSERQHTRGPLLERAFTLLPEPLILLDAEYNVIALNRAAEHAFGTDTSWAEGRPVFSLPGMASLAPLLESGHEVDFWTREGSDKVYAPRLITLDAGGGYALVFSDMTRYRTLDRNHAEFIRVVTHDLRNPVASGLMVVGMLESLLDTEADADKVALLARLERGLTLLNTHIDNIQDAGRYDPETGFYQMRRQPVDLREMAHRVMANQLVDPKRQLGLSVIVDDDMPLVNADMVMLERAMTNLVDNAIKYTPEGGDVELHVRREPERLVVCVRDTGLGIHEDDQKRLFQRHSRLSRREHRQIKGTGLGLFIVRSVAQRHGGDAWVESQAGHGSTFCFSIPLEGDNLLESQP